MTEEVADVIPPPRYVSKDDISDDEDEDEDDDEDDEDDDDKYTYDDFMTEEYLELKKVRSGRSVVDLGWSGGGLLSGAIFLHFLTLNALFPTLQKYDEQSMQQTKASAQPAPAPPARGVAAARSESNPTTTRIALFPMLISELVKEKLMSDSDGRKLLSMFANEHPTINAALDVYDVDSDIAELVDTLHRCVAIDP